MNMSCKSNMTSFADSVERWTASLYSVEVEEFNTQYTSYFKVRSFMGFHAAVERTCFSLFGLSPWLR